MIFSFTDIINVALALKRQEQDGAQLGKVGWTFVSFFKSVKSDYG